MPDEAPPGDVLEFAMRTLGGFELVRDCSWDHRMSSVLQLRDADGRSWFLKRHRDRERYDTELHAYREWVPALADRAPALHAFDDSLGAIIMSGLPAESAVHADQSVQRQAGTLLRQFHEAQAPVACDGFGSVKARELDRMVPLIMHLVSGHELQSARSAVAALGDVPSPGLVPCHRDYTPRNWLAGDGLVRIVDFEWCRLDAWVSDLARLELGLWADRPDLRDAFLDGYGARLSDADRVVLRGCAVVTAVWLLAKAIETRQPSFANANREALLRLLSHPAW
jgi:hypothetical protein